MIYAEKHLSLLSRMERDGLQLRFTGEFPEEILDQTCKKIEDMGLQEQIRKEEATQIQRELIQVPEFAELYQALCAHGIAVSVIQTMLHAASSYQEHLSQYPKEQVLEAAVLDLKPGYLPCSGVAGNLSADGTSAFNDASAVSWHLSIQLARP